MSNLIVVFISGLTVGGLSCLAVQGGLLATLIAGRAERDLAGAKKRSIGAALAIILFLLAKLTIHTVFGFGLGFLGSKLQLSLEARIVMSILAGLFMIGTALRILDLHPIFRYLSIQPPKFVFRLVRNQSKSQDLFAPVLLGMMTVLIPCGTTQAMEVLAVASGSPLIGAAIMFVFVLGTSPVFFVLGYLASRLGEAMHRNFLRLAAILVAILGLLSINTGLSLAGHPFKLSLIEIDGPGSNSVSAGDSSVQVKDGVQEATITVYPTSYAPGNIYVSSSKPIKLKMQTGSGIFCTNNIVFPGLNKQYFLNPSSVTTIDLGIQPAGNVYYICGSGMYSGNIVVRPGA